MNANTLPNGSDGQDELAHDGSRIPPDDREERVDFG
jgi:hypothetical protein